MRQIVRLVRFGIKPWEEGRLPLGVHRYLELTAGALDRIGEQQGG